MDTILAETCTELNSPVGSIATGFSSHKRHLAKHVHHILSQILYKLTKRYAQRKSLLYLAALWNFPHF